MGNVGKGMQMFRKEPLHFWEESWKGVCVYNPFHNSTPPRGVHKSNDSTNLLAVSPDMHQHTTAGCICLSRRTAKKISMREWGEQPGCNDSNRLNVCEWSLVWYQWQPGCSDNNELWKRARDLNIITLQDVDQESVGVRPQLAVSLISLHPTFLLGLPKCYNSKT